MIKKDADSIPVALECEHLRAAVEGEYFTTKFYALEGQEGLYRRVNRSGHGLGVTRPGALLARWGPGLIELVSDPALEEELRQAGYVLFRSLPGLPVEGTVRPMTAMPREMDFVGHYQAPAAPAPPENHPASDPAPPPPPAFPPPTADEARLRLEADLIRRIRERTAAGQPADSLSRELMALRARHAGPAPAAPASDQMTAVEKNNAYDPDPVGHTWGRDDTFAAAPQPPGQMTAAEILARRTGAEPLPAAQDQPAGPEPAAPGPEAAQSRRGRRRAE